jgi:hypothetical protein
MNRYNIFGEGYEKEKKNTKAGDNEEEKKNLFSISSPFLAQTKQQRTS